MKTEGSSQDPALQFALDAGAHAILGGFPLAQLLERQPLAAGWGRTRRGLRGGVRRPRGKSGGTQAVIPGAAATANAL
jgi:hypothetical protein